MYSQTKSKQAKTAVINLLKNSAKETLSIRLSREVIRLLSIELSDIKRKNPGMKKLTLSKYVSALVESMAQSEKMEE